MKQLFVFAVIYIMIAGCISKQDKYIGAWFGKTVAKDTIMIVFDPDGYAAIMKNSEVLGGKNKEGVNSTKYVFDWSKEPVWLDFIEFTDNKETYRNKLVVRFISKDKMLLAPRLKQAPDFEDGTILTRIK